jgi:hypothetical protein
MSDFIVNPPNNSCEAATPNAGASVTSLVTYDGTDLSCIGFTSGDNLNTALSSMNSAICALTDTISLYNTNIRSYQQQISQISNTVNNLSCSDIRTTDLIWACIAPVGDTLCGVLTAMEAKICANESGVMSASQECTVDGLIDYTSKIRKKFVYDGDFTEAVHGVGVFNTSGGTAADDNGCTETVSSGAVGLTALSTNWVKSKKGLGVVNDVTALAAPEPTVGDDEVRLYKVDTDAGNNIVLVTDQRKLKPYDESFFEASTDMSAFLGVGGVNSDKLNLDAKLTYNAAYTFTADEDIVSKKYVDDSLASSVPVVFWNTSGATTYYDAGAVGIGTSTPDVTQSAHIVGSLRYEDTNEAAGKFLTCDATGIATWASLPVLASTIEGRDEGSVINNFTAINFLGAGVTSVDGGGGVFDVTISGSVAGFTDLSDTAVTYAGSGDFFLRVNTGENSVDFVDGSTINISTFNNDSGFITSYTEIDDLENVLSRDNSTGAYDISILSGQSIKYNNSGFTATILESTLTGDIVLSLPAASGTLASLSDLSSFITGVDLSYTAATRTINNSQGLDAVLPLFNSTEAGLVPLSGGGVVNFLRADGTWAASGNGIYDGSGSLGADTTITQNAFNLELQGNGGLFTTNANTSWSLGAVLNSGFQMYQVVSTHSTGHYIIQQKGDVSSDVYGQSILSNSAKTGAATLYGGHYNIVGTHALGTNVGSYFNAENALNNYSAVFNSGNIGFAETAVALADSIKLVQSLGVITFDGTAGGLFAITDDKDNQLFGVADVSGNDIMYADADWLIKMGNPFQTGGVPLELNYNDSTGDTQMNMNSNTYNIGNLVDYADDTAAGVGGLVTGDLYRVTASKAIAVKD